jgi:hypothetical protein
MRISTISYAESNGWYFCPCLAHKTIGKAQQTLGPEIPQLINFPARKFYKAIIRKRIDPNKLINKQTHRQNIKRLPNLAWAPQYISLSSVTVKYLIFLKY